MSTTAAGGTYMQVWDKTHTTLLSVIPEFESITVQDEINQPGQLTAALALSGKGVDALADAPSALIDVYERGQFIQTFVYDEDDTDDADLNAENAELDITAPGAMSMLDWILVYPQAGFDTPQYQDFVNISPGQVLLTLLAAGKARGVLDGTSNPDVTTSFSEVYDSDGVMWPSYVWIRYTAGSTTMLAVAQDLVDKGYIDFRMVGTRIDAYAHVKEGTAAWYAALTSSSGPSMQVDVPAIVLHRSQLVTAAPRRRQRSTVGTAVLGLGEGNLSLERADADAIALYGRREVVASQGGVTDAATLAVLTQLSLDNSRAPVQSWTVDYVRTTGDVGGLPPAQPWTSYHVGNWIRCDWLRGNADGTPGTALLPVRVMSITAVLDTSGPKSVELELNDIILDAETAVARRIAALLVSTSPANPGGVDQPITTDKVGPQPVAFVSLDPEVLLNPDGSYQAVCLISWPTVEFNTDGTPFDDLGAYQVQWRVGSFADPAAGWTGSVSTQSLEVGVSNLTPGQIFQARVLPFDFNGNFPKHDDGTPKWTLSPTIPLQRDGVAPSTPDAPSVTALAGGISVTWDGKDHLGVTMPADFQQVEVHVSTVNNFTPSTLLPTPTNATLVDTIVGQAAGASTVITAPQVITSTPYYVRLVAVDSAGNRSPAGDQAGPVTPRFIGPADLDPSVLTDTDHTALFPGDTDWTGGSVVTDAAARDGAAERVAPGQTGLSTAYTALKPGRYRATWLIRTDAVSSSTPPIVGILNVGGTAVTSDGARTVTTLDATSLTGYRTVSVMFTVTAATNSIQLSAAATAAATMWISNAYVQPVESAAVAEFQDANIANLTVTKILGGTLTADVIAAANPITGAPGRIRVGVVDPLTGSANMPGFSIGSDGIRGQTTGGVQTLLVDPTTGSVFVTGTIKVGSLMPGSVYSGNLVQNASFEDLDPTATANTAGVLPLTWTDSAAVTGTASSAYADTSLVLGGLQSLTVRLDNTTSGRVVKSQQFPVIAGERLQQSVLMKLAGPTAPVLVRMAFYDAVGNLLGVTPAIPDNCSLMLPNGTSPLPIVGGSGAGFADIVSAVVVGAGIAFRAAGSVVVPNGASFARVLLGAWTRGTGVGSTWITFDSVVVQRSEDGSTLNNAAIIAPLIETAQTGARIAIVAQQDAKSIFLYTGQTNETPGRLSVGNAPVAAGGGSLSNIVWLQGNLATGGNDRTPAILFLSKTNALADTGQAVASILFYGINAGGQFDPAVAVGVYVGSGSNSGSFLVVNGQITVTGGIYMPGGQITGAISVTGGLTVQGALGATGGLGITGGATISGGGSWSGGPTITSAQLNGGPALSGGGSWTGSPTINAATLAAGVNIPGLVGGTSLTTLGVNSSGNVKLVSSSSRRFKKKIRDLTHAEADRAYELREVTFEWRNAKEYGPGREMGLTAEDVLEVFPEMVGLDEKGRPRSVSYDKLVVPLLSIVRRQRDALDALAERVAALEA